MMQSWRLRYDIWRTLTKIYSNTRFYIQGRLSRSTVSFAKQCAIFNNIWLVYLSKAIHAILRYLLIQFPVSFSPMAMAALERCFVQSIIGRCGVHIELIMYIMYGNPGRNPWKRNRFLGVHFPGNLPQYRQNVSVTLTMRNGSECDEPDPWKEFLVSVRPYNALNVSGALTRALKQHMRYWSFTQTSPMPYIPYWVSWSNQGSPILDRIGWRQHQRHKRATARPTINISNCTDNLEQGRSSFMYLVIYPHSRSKKNLPRCSP